MQCVGKCIEIQGTLRHPCMCRSGSCIFVSAHEICNVATMAGECQQYSHLQRMPALAITIKTGFNSYLGLKCMQDCRTPMYYFSSE